MTSKVALVIAFSLLLNEVHILFDTTILRNKYFTSNLVYLLSICLVLREIELLPRVLRRKSTLLCLLLEIPFSILLLESLLFYVWKPMLDYLLLNADGILVYLAEDHGLEWLVCHLCCGQSNCSSIFADAVLKVLSYAILFTVCFFVKSK